MIHEFRQFIEQENLCEKEDKILMAVSSGIDSIVLLDLFLKSEYKVIIAHCNFKLRGEESDEDERFVKQLGKEKNLETLTKSFDTIGYANERHCSIQEAARELRYTWFDDLCNEKGIDKIAVGHHKDDQIETFFINLLRGSSLKGLKGIPVQRDKIVRPLMFANRQQIRNYAANQNLKYREDSSNSSDKYLRNSIRNNLIPLLTEIKTSSIDSILKSIGHLKEDHQDFYKLIDDLRDRLIRKEKVTKIRLADIEVLNSSLVYHLLKIYNVNRRVSNDILFGIQNKSIGNVFYSGSYKLLIDREYLFIEEIKLTVPKYEFLIEDNAKDIHQPIHLSFKRLKKDKSLQVNKNPEYAYFDADKLVFPLKLRKWRNGDWLVPFGMHGKKLVSDFLIDAKISRFDKENVWVLLSEENIIWIVGYRTSELYRLGKDTKACLKIVYQP